MSQVDCTLRAHLLSRAHCWHCSSLRARWRARSIRRESRSSSPPCSNPEIEISECWNQRSVSLVSSEYRQNRPHSTSYFPRSWYFLRLRWLHHSLARDQCRSHLYFLPQQGNLGSQTTQSFTSRCRGGEENWVILAQSVPVSFQNSRAGLLLRSHAWFLRQLSCLH